MHELALARALAQSVLEHAEGRPVCRVCVRVGALTGVVADSLCAAFDACALGTFADGAELEIVPVPGRGRCRTCGVEAEYEELWQPCACGSHDLEWMAGLEMRVLSIDVRDPVK